jgi:hypothetical protein
MSVTITNSTTINDTVPVIFRTIYNVQATAMGLPSTNLLILTEGTIPTNRATHVYSGGAPNGGPVLNIAYVSGTTCTPTLLYPAGAISVTTSTGSVVSSGDSNLPAFPINVNLSGTNTITFTFNASNSGANTIPTVFDPNTGFGINVNGLRSGRINSFTSGNVFTYSFDQNAVNIIFTFDVTPSTTTMYINVVSLLMGTLTPFQSTVAAWNTPGFTNADSLFTLTISSMTITYTPVSLTDVLMNISLPQGGFQWSSILPSAQGPFTFAADHNTAVLLSLPGNRTISTRLYQGALLNNVVVPASSITVTSGATSVNVPAVPSPSPAVVTVEPFCIHPDSMVHTSNGLLKLSSLRSDQNIELVGLDGDLVPMLFNAKFSGSSKFVMYPKGCLGPDQPSEDLFVTEGHPIFVKGRECISKYMINGVIQLVTKPTDVTYAPVTENRTFTLINNVPVCTWALSELKEIGKKKGLYYELI